MMFRAAYTTGQRTQRKTKRRNLCQVFHARLNDTVRQAKTAKNKARDAKIFLCAFYLLNARVGIFTNNGGKNLCFSFTLPSLRATCCNKKALQLERFSIMLQEIKYYLLLPLVSPSKSKVRPKRRVLDKGFWLIPLPEGMI